MKNTDLRERFLGSLGPDSQAFLLFDFLPGLSFFVKDRQGRFIALNRRGCEYCGVASEEEAIGRTDYDFFPKSRADEYRADDAAIMESGQPIVDRVESAPEDAGSPRLVMTSKIPLRDKRNRVIGVAGFSRQIERIQTPSGTVDAFANVITHLHENFADRLSTDELAEMAGLSVSHFERRFRRAFSASPRQYLVRIRVEHAARMLRETDKTVSEIAHECGFYDHAHFSRSFRKIMQLSPSEYRCR
ncbi:AraC family transcriptional regulator [Allorhodopirellula solitaria]|uniref:HTH-type transcriptional activator RhaS n=1 Tax=Allorhodopirellula solitaria TaxID=2527987 RepID=A0A5C5XXV4_9BACT|nr:AraC family transcriptional regulator [Allorhodopirellula solitaria]TWT67508.1 HTH-type transcriptional activator RhaS [Allorhodopirellula solitaria]